MYDFRTQPTRTIVGAHRWANRLPDTPVISIVDDDESIRSGTASLVRSLGFVAHAFPSARAFLHSEQLAQTSCLISDIQMPEMSGIELHDILRTRGHNTPIIFITAFPDEKAHAQALVRGAVCFLSKPLDGDTLSRCLDVALKNNAGESD
ncbi:MAG: response regulator [Mesorhizobium sp.]|nr:MAG: response regulator [Mesorhizobium sp.]